jgi:hypothetical protein
MLMNTHAILLLLPQFFYFALCFMLLDVHDIDYKPTVLTFQLVTALDLMNIDFFNRNEFLAFGALNSIELH